jgi:hypothetical protein
MSNDITSSPAKLDNPSLQDAVKMRFIKDQLLAIFQQWNMKTCTGTAVNVSQYYILLSTGWPEAQGLVPAAN